MGSLLMERIFWSTPNGVLMAHAEYLLDVKPGQFSTACAVHIDVVRVGGCPAVVA